MKTTTLKLMREAALIPYILLAVHAFFIRKVVLFGFFFLGFEVFNYLFLRQLRNFTSKEEKIRIIGRIVYAWMFIFLFSFLYLRDTPYRYIFFGLAWAVLGLFLAWAKLSGRWEEVCTLPP
ncbi:MAG: hypothetical protein PVF58_18790 [Candidatus Methanofastidiosia archaeon]|jgi:hypothetical protein